MDKNELLEKIKKNMIVSCQALKGHYTKKGGVMKLIALAAERAGASGSQIAIRTHTLEKERALLNACVNTTIKVSIDENEQLS